MPKANKLPEIFLLSDGETPEPPPKRKPGRPPKAQANINWAAFDALCYCCCTLREIAFYFKVSEDTIENTVKKVHGMRFKDYYAQKEHVGKASLRQAQFRKAMEGNPAMLIWLGKQMLGQKDRAEISAPSDLTKMTDADLMKMAEQYGVKVDEDKPKKQEAGAGQGPSHPRVN